MANAHNLNGSVQNGQRSVRNRRNASFDEILYGAKMYRNAIARKSYRASGNTVWPGKGLFSFLIVCATIYWMVGQYSDQPKNGKQMIATAGMELSWAQELAQVVLPKKSAQSKGNAYAPVSSKQMTEDDVKRYVNSYAKIAVAEMDKFGIPASISLAQGLVESRAGSSKLAVKNNNHFGIKCFSRKCARGHCSNHFDDHHKDFFRIFKSSWASWRSHSELLASKHYASLQKHGRNYKSWAKGLKQLGYATDQNYDKKLIQIIEQYKLYQYDEL